MRSDQKLLLDMIDSIETIFSYEITSLEDLEADEKTQDAVMFNLIIMGEAANGLSDDFTEKHNDILWNKIIGTRNIIVHGYDMIKLSIVWDIIKIDLPKLIDQLRSLI